MHDKLVNQLRNSEHCGGCPYDKDCNDFNSCLLDLLAADAIEDMSKRIVMLEKESQEKEMYIKDREYFYCCPVCSNEYDQEIVADVIRYHTSSSCSRKMIEVKYCPNCGRKLGN